jgi:radical SAM protein with 4Fe4S-binding SPASM domain
LVATRLNFHEIPLWEKLAKEYGAGRRLSRLRPAGGGKEVWDQFSLSKEQLQELSAFLGSRPDILTADSFFAIAARDRRSMGLGMCGAARMTCSVSPDGSVYPCAFLQDDLFFAGNIARQSLESIWHNSEPFRLMRGLRIQSCETCLRFDLCHGGCPAVAYYLMGSLRQKDPECMATFRQGLMVENPVTRETR